MNVLKQSLKNHPTEKLYQLCRTIKKHMGNTYSQVYLQFVFAVRWRHSLITKQHKERLHQYFTGLVQNRNSKMLAINCMPDHLHLFTGYDPSLSIPEFVKQIKVGSTKFIRGNDWGLSKFNWQEGYGVFSYSRSDVDSVVKYILNQEEHHRRQKFKEEYLALLAEFDVSFKEEYLFEFF